MLKELLLLAIINQPVPQEDLEATSLLMSQKFNQEIVIDKAYYKEVLEYKIFCGIGKLNNKENKFAYILGDNDMALADNAEKFCNFKGTK